MCGEKVTSKVSPGKTSGSPPRVRGKASRTWKNSTSQRITPACAGKSFQLFVIYNICGDHPRVCGEKLSWAMPTSSRVGSPPRVRGKDNPSFDVKTSVGITPACAGKSSPRGLPRSCRWDHPRVCGEKIMDNMYLDTYWGSPPRVRGKARFSRRRTNRTRITPACAGKSHHRLTRCQPSQDHPRVCGEK